MDYTAYLTTAITDTDLAYYLDNSDMMDLSIEYAQDAIANRLNVAVEDIPAKYDMSVVQGAVWYLSRLGTEGETQNSEGDITRTFEEIPTWLKRIVPYVGVVKVAGTK